MCEWLSFPEIGVYCTRNTIKSARLYFSIERRNGYSYRVYQCQLPRNTKGISASGVEKDATWEERVFMTSSFKCHRCGQSMNGKTIGQHLEKVEHISVNLIAVSIDRYELYLADTQEPLATWIEKSS
jgi:hypothetical protein